MRYSVTMTTLLGRVVALYDGVEEGTAKAVVYDAIFTAFPGEGHVTIVAEADASNPGSADFFAYRGFESICLHFNAIPTN